MSAFVKGVNHDEDGSFLETTFDANEQLDEELLKLPTKGCLFDIWYLLDHPGNSAPNAMVKLAKPIRQCANEQCSVVSSCHTLREKRKCTETAEVPEDVGHGRCDRALACTWESVQPINVALDGQAKISARMSMRVSGRYSGPIISSSQRVSFGNVC